MLVAPSPKKQTLTWPDFRICDDQAAPSASGMCAPDDRVRAHVSMVDAGEVHRTALAAIQPSGPSCEFQENGQHGHTARECVRVPP